MQFRPTFCLWMEPGNPAEVLEAFRRRWQKEPFAGAAHVFVEPAGAFLKLSDDEWHRRIRGALSETGEQKPGLTLCHVWNLAYAPEGFFDQCIDVLLQVHERLDSFLRLNSNLYPQLHNRLCQLILRLPLQGQETPGSAWLERIGKIQNARMPLSRVIVVGNSNVHPEDHPEGVTVRDSEVRTHLEETLVALLESGAETLLGAAVQPGRLPFCSVGCARVVMDLKNAGEYRARHQAARLLDEQLREDGAIARPDPAAGVLEELDLDPERVLQNLLEGADPHRPTCLNALRNLGLPAMDARELEGPDGPDMPAAWMTRGMMELSESLGTAYDRMQENRHWFTARTARRLFERIRENLQDGTNLYWVQARHQLERIQDANQRAKGAYPQAVEAAFSGKPAASGTTGTNWKQALSEILPPNESPRPDAGEPPPDPARAYRELRHRVQERKWAPSHLARWTLGFLPFALLLGLWGGSLGWWPLVLHAAVAAGAAGLGCLLGAYILYREKSLRAQGVAVFREALRAFARMRLKQLLKDQGALHHDHLHALMGEPEETASRKILDPEKAFGRHARNPEMQSVIEMDFHQRLFVVRARMKAISEKLKETPWVPALASSRWLISFFNEETLRLFPFLAPPANGQLNRIDKTQSPPEKEQIAACLKPEKPEKKEPGPWARFWETLEESPYQSQWAKHLREQGFWYFEKLPIEAFLDFIHAEDPAITAKAAREIQLAAHPYWRLSTSGSPFYIFAHAVHPQGSGMAANPVVQKLVDGYTRERLPAWDGLPGVVCMKVEVIETEHTMHPLPIAHAGGMPDPNLPDGGSTPISYV